MLLWFGDFLECASGRRGCARQALLCEARVSWWLYAFSVEERNGVHCMRVVVVVGDVCFGGEMRSMLF